MLLDTMYVCPIQNQCTYMYLKFQFYTCNLPMLGLLIILTVSLLVMFKVETNNMPTCSVFINNCSLTDAPLASSSKD